MKLYPGQRFILVIDNTEDTDIPKKDVRERFIYPHCTPMKFAGSS